MAEYQPPLPPRIMKQLPDSPFEAWLIRQAVNGHDKQWLERNKVALQKRFKALGEKDLPPANSGHEKVPDRYDEL